MKSKRTTQGRTSTSRKTASKAKPKKRATAKAKPKRVTKPTPRPKKTAKKVVKKVAKKKTVAKPAERKMAAVGPRGAAGKGKKLTKRRRSASGGDEEQEMGKASKEEDGDFDTYEREQDVEADIDSEGEEYLDKNLGWGGLERRSGESGDKYTAYSAGFEDDSDYIYGEGDKYIDLDKFYKDYEDEYF